jgi:hypothetical protein
LERVPGTESRIAPYTFVLLTLAIEERSSSFFFFCCFFFFFFKVRVLPEEACHSETTGGRG